MLYRRQRDHWWCIEFIINYCTIWRNNVMYNLFHSRKYWQTTVYAYKCWNYRGQLDVTRITLASYKSYIKGFSQHNWSTDVSYAYCYHAYSKINGRTVRLHHQFSPFLYSSHRLTFLPSAVAQTSINHHHHHHHHLCPYYLSIIVSTHFAMYLYS